MILNTTPPRPVSSTILVCHKLTLYPTINSGPLVVELTAGAWPIDKA